MWIEGKKPSKKGPTLGKSKLTNCQLTITRLFY